MTINDITEKIPYDLSGPSDAEKPFEITNIKYDVVIDNLPFVANITNQYKYTRQTAQYRKDQFDNSADPGEQSLSGWWLRSQSSFHNGAGIGFYEPGTDQAHTTHRFHDSRGVDVWTEGEATLLKDVFEGYTGSHNINGCIAKFGAVDCMMIGNSTGSLHRTTLSGDSAMSDTDLTSFLQPNPGTTGHGTTHPFASLTSDGTRYFAVCDVAVHRGNVNGTTSVELNDEVIYRHGNSSNMHIEYAKGWLFMGDGANLYRLDANKTAINHDTGSTTMPTGIDLKVHQNTAWSWNSIAGGTSKVYASGFAGNHSEIWAIGFTADSTTSFVAQPDMRSAVMVAQLPYGEVVNNIEFYLGTLMIGTNKGMRVGQTDADGNIVYGPLLYESDYGVNGFAFKDRFAFGATQVMGVDNKLNACLVRVDLSQQFDDGTYAYAYDLEYQSSLDGDDTEATEVYLMDDRLVMVVEENSDTTKGELQVESSATYRSTGWLQTGSIRFGTLEPKFFKFINLKLNTGTGDSIAISTIDDQGNEIELTSVTTGLSNIENALETLSTKQERVAFKFTFNNATLDSSLPRLKAWQVKAIPATKRQRLITYPLSCYNSEMDRDNKQFGYPGRALTMIQGLENLEETGKFVTVTDYRIGETYTGVIENIDFGNESSADKNSSGFGGIVQVTVRKM